MFLVSSVCQYICVSIPPPPSCLFYTLSSIITFTFTFPFTNTGVLLIWFPGSTLVYGAYEVFMGSYTNGGVRLIKGIVSAMVIALFYTFGWQYWGMNWASNETMLGVPTNLYNTTGAIASLPPSTNCKSPNPPYELPWYISEVVFAIPLNAATMVVFNIRLQDAGGVFLVAQATYCIQGAIKNCGGESDGLYCGIPTYVTTLFIAFFAGCLSEINAYLTGFSKYGSMLAVIFVLAPVRFHHHIMACHVTGFAWFCSVSFSFFRSIVYSNYYLLLEGCNWMINHVKNHFTI